MLARKVLLDFKISISKIITKGLLSYEERMPSLILKLKGGIKN